MSVLRPQQPGQEKQHPLPLSGVSVPAGAVSGQRGSPSALLHGCSQETAVENPLTAGWAEKGKEGPALSPRSWKAQQVFFFSIT